MNEQRDEHGPKKFEIFFSSMYSVDILLLWLTASTRNYMYKTKLLHKSNREKGKFNLYFLYNVWIVPYIHHYMSSGNLSVSENYPHIQNRTIKAKYTKYATVCFIIWRLASSFFLCRSSFLYKNTSVEVCMSVF